MSKLLDEIQAVLNGARKTGDTERAAILALLVGAVQQVKFAKNRTTDVTDDEIQAIVKAKMNGNLEVIEKWSDKAPETAAAAERENNILRTWLPVYVSENIIRDILLPHINEIRAAKNEGGAKGLAFKAIKTLGVKAESETVMKIVAQIREVTE